MNLTCKSVTIEKVSFKISHLELNNVATMCALHACGTDNNVLSSGNNNNKKKNKSICRQKSEQTMWKNAPSNDIHQFIFCCSNLFGVLYDQNVIKKKCNFPLSFTSTYAITSCQLYKYALHGNVRKKSSCGFISFDCNWAWHYTSTRGLCFTTDDCQQKKMKKKKKKKR